MTKTERLLKLASLSNTERKKRRKDTDLSDVEIKEFEHGTFIFVTHMNQNGSVTQEIAATLTCADTGYVIVEK